MPATFSVHVSDTRALRAAPARCAERVCESCSYDICAASPHADTLIVRVQLGQGRWGGGHETQAGWISMEVGDQ